MMKLADLVKPISEQTEEELLERLRQVRHNRFVERPAAKKKAAKEAAEKTPRKKATSTEALLANLSEADRDALIAKLTAQVGGTGGGQTQDDKDGSDQGGGEVPG